MKNSKMWNKSKNKHLKMNINNNNIYANTIYGNNIEEDAVIPLCVLEINERSNSLQDDGDQVASTSQTIFYDPEPGSTNDLTIGSLVEVMNDVSEQPLYGVIRWMGVEAGSNFILTGVELEEEQSHLPLILTDGTHKGQRFFDCANNKALFVPLNQCHKDSRFQDGITTPIHNVTEKMFGKVVFLTI